MVYLKAASKSRYRAWSYRIKWGMEWEAGGRKPAWPNHGIHLLG